MGRQRLALALALLISALMAAPAQATIHLSFGLYTSNKPTAMVKQFRPVLDLIERHMTQTLGTPVKIRIQVANDYSQGIEHLASGKVDFSRFGPASYVEAKRANAGLRILAMERVRGEKVFYGIIAVRKDSPIKSMQDLHGRSFAFGDDQSTIGRYLSQLYLRNHGIYSSDLSRFDYLGRHDIVGTSVGAGHFDAGALNEATFSKLVAKGVPIRELARFTNVTKPWIAREGLPDRLFEALREALLSTDAPVLKTTLKADGFVVGEDADYAEIRDAIELNNKFFEPPTALASSGAAASASPAGDSSSGQAAQSSAAVPPTSGWGERDIDVPGVHALEPGVGWAEADIDVNTSTARSSSGPAMSSGWTVETVTASEDSAPMPPTSKHGVRKAGALAVPADKSRGAGAAASGLAPGVEAADVIRIH